jgi:hypothetical protein
LLLQEIFLELRLSQFLESALILDQIRPHLPLEHFLPLFIKYCQFGVQIQKLEQHLRSILIFMDLQEDFDLVLLRILLDFDCEIIGAPEPKLQLLYVVEDAPLDIEITQLVGRQSADMQLYGDWRICVLNDVQEEREVTVEHLAV